MSTYYETARTNYFRVRSPEAFDTFLSKFAGVEKSIDKDGLVCVLFDECGVPTSCEEDGEIVDVDFLSELSRHLADNSIAVVMAVGNERMRFVNGYSSAINSRGECVTVTLDDIYGLARQKFGLDAEVTKAEY